MPDAPQPVDLHFPLAGLDVSTAYDRQPNRPVAGGDYARTTPVAVNVRAYEPRTDRSRGGSRSGLSRYPPTVIHGGDPIQDITTVTLSKPAVTSPADPGGTISPGPAADQVVVLGDADGAVVQTVAALIGPAGGGCFDTSGRAYLFAIRGSGSHELQITKVNPSTGATTFQTLPYNVGVPAVVVGGVVVGSILYVCVRYTGSHISPLFRVDAVDGSALDLSNFSYYTGDANAIVGTALGLGVFGKFTSGRAVLATYGLDGGLTGTTILRDDDSTQTAGGLAVDPGGGYYVSASYNYGFPRIDAEIVRVGSWVQLHQDFAGSSGIALGLAFDALGNRLACVGPNLLGGGNSFETRDPATGSMLTGGQPAASTFWSVVVNDGAGSFRLADLTSVILMGGDLAVQWTTNPGVSPTWLAATGVSIGPPSTDTMRSTRSIVNLAVAGGALCKFTRDAVTVVADPFLSAAASTVFGQALAGKVYYLDGVSYKVYDPVANTVVDWTTTDGDLPRGGGETGRLICLWRGRAVISGLRSDPQNWFMSRVDFPRDFDYSPLSIDPTQAIAGNNSAAGLVGDVITALIPYSDDVLIFGGDHTIYQMTGDPMSGGRIDRLSDTIGMAWGRPFCRDPNGTLYFFGSRGGVFQMQPGQIPQRVSLPITPLLAAVDVGSNTIRMAWEDGAQGLYLTITPFLAGAAATHYYWESRTNGWFQVRFTMPGMNPRVLWTLDGDGPSDRALLLGCLDGWIRQFDGAATDDDGVPIQSRVLIGPLLSPDYGELMLYSLQPGLGEGSGPVTYEIYAGLTAEAALQSGPVETGTWQPGRNLRTPCRRAGHALYVGVSSASAWALEGIGALVSGLGKIRGRGRGRPR